MKNKRMAVDAMIAATYTVLSLVLTAFSFGPIQVRVAEVLCILCIYKKEYIGPITLGCALTNFIGVIMGADIIGFLDVIFGTLATYLSVVMMYKFRDIKCFNRPLLSYMMPVIFNGLIVGAMLSYVIMPDNFIYGLLLNGFYVAIGEFISVVVLGILLEKTIAKLVDIIG